jgi:L-arabinokinase
VFLERYKGITDPVTRVDPTRTYLVQQPTAHPIYEHFRVRTFAEILKNPVSLQSREVLGELMHQSHTSYSACGISSAGCDLLVRLVRQAGPDRGLYGAKITGGGSGGTVAVLGRRDAFETVKEITDRYARETGYRPYVFAGSSPGANAFGHLLLKNTP